MDINLFSDKIKKGKILFFLQVQVYVMIRV